MRIIAFFFLRCFGFGLVVLPALFALLHMQEISRSKTLARFEREGEFVSAEVLGRRRQFNFFSRDHQTRYYLHVRFSERYESRELEIEVPPHEYRTGFPGKSILTRVLKDDEPRIQYPVISNVGADKEAQTLTSLLLWLIGLNFAVSASILASAYNARYHGEVVYVMYDRHKTLAAGNGAVHWLELPAEIKSSSTPFRFHSAQMPHVDDMKHGDQMRMYRTPIFGYLWWEYALPFPIAARQRAV